jgi:hypothetical protein
VWETKKESCQSRKDPLRSLSVGDKARPRLPVRDLLFTEEVGLLPLDSYCSELDDECTSDELLG